MDCSVTTHSLFNDWKSHLRLFWLGGAEKPGDEEGDVLCSAKIAKLGF